MGAVSVIPAKKKTRHQMKGTTAIFGMGTGPEMDEAGRGCGCCNDSAARPVFLHASRAGDTRTDEYSLWLSAPLSAHPLHRVSRAIARPVIGDYMSAGQPAENDAWRIRVHHVERYDSRYD